MSDRLRTLSDAGVSIWLDDLDRGRLQSGGLAALVRDDSVVGVTTNPTIFAKAVSSGAAEYAEQLAGLAERGVSVEEAVRALTTYDVRWACDVLREVWESTGGVDGRVSIEVDPRLARRTAATVAEAQFLAWAVDRPNALVKIPATQEGLPAITSVLGDGISVNVTLIFSVERYRGVLEAWLAGLERADAAGHDLATIESVASFFVSRVDTEVDKRLTALGTPEALALKGVAAIANARHAWSAYQEVLASDRWKALQDKGAHPQRPLWASTGVKDPAYPDTRYVVDLVVPGTVNTMPEATLRAVADHGEATGDQVTPHQAAAAEQLAAIGRAGVDLADVYRVLEDEGVEKFDASWQELLQTVAKALDERRG
ncbi:MAG: transaldolase [Actinomycetota bacterium]|nr:MAG: transaldolase [Actinomycetota bacterium]